MAVVNGQYVPLAGDVILEARALIPDAPNTLANPTSSAAVVTATGSTLPTGVYRCVVTQFNYWGETLGAAEVSTLTVGANQGIQITSALLPGATKIRAYLTLPSGAAGSECQFAESNSSPFTISTPLTNAGNPPEMNSAFNPDTDGQLLSTSAVYRYLNAGLKIISRVSGGLLDYCGVGSVQGQPLYTIPGQWIEITSIWYDGYWMLGGDRASFFRRTSIQSSVLSAGSVSVQDNRQVIEVYPQPARTAAVTTLTSPMGTTDTSATLTDASGFLLPFGFVQIDNEQMAYSQISGNVLSGLIRGLGGSTSAAHSVSAPTNELNIFWSGKRQFSPTFQSGNSTSTLPVPNGWDELLIQYVAGRAKLVEHDFEAFKSFDEQMVRSVKEWATTNKGVVRRRQVGGGSNVGVLYPDIAGGLIRN